MKPKLCFLIASVTCIQMILPASSAPASRAPSTNLSDPFNAGLHFMSKNDYVSAIGYFEKAVRKRKYKNCAIVHYYLANALWKRGRKDDALIAYGKSYVLDPTGETAKHAVKVLRHFAPRVKSIASKRTLTAKGKKVLKAAGVNPGAVKQPAKSKPAIDSDLIAYVKKRAPGLPEYKRSSPSSAEFHAWRLARQAEYIGPAEARLGRAKAALNAGLNQFGRAKRYATRLIPQHRNHGESQADFLARRKAGKAEYDIVMEPYRSEIANRAGYVNELIRIRNSAWLQWGQSRCIPEISVPKETLPKKG